MKKIFLILLIGSWIFSFLQYSAYQNFLTEEIIIENNTLVVPKWAYPTNFLVEEFGMNEKFVKLYFRLNDVDARLEAWTFQMQEPITIQNFFTKLDTPIIEWDVDLVIIEGNTIFDIDACLSSPATMKSSASGKTWCVFDRSWEEEVVVSESFISSWEFIRYAQSSQAVSDFQGEYSFLQWVETLEWFLHPDSYKINKNTFSIEWMVKKMLDNFERKVMQDEELLAKFWNNLSQEVRNNIIIASIVEKEIASPETREVDEAEKVAWVLKKRYEEDWQIGADATVCYPYEILSKDCTPSFVLDKLYDKTAYNTRQMVGLPQTPISNPFAGTIKSTLLSEDSVYYFYLHAPDGKIYYARTNADHEQNKARYLN